MKQKLKNIEDMLEMGERINKKGLVLLTIKATIFTIA
jgi:hypothetical protein